MGSNESSVATIEDLIADGAILAHKDGNYGSNYPRVEEFGSDGVPFLTAKSLRGGYVDIAGAPRLSEKRADGLNFGFVQEGDVLLSHNATIGRVAIVPPCKERLLVGTSLTYFRLDPQKLLPRYLAVYFAGSEFQNQLAAVMSHSTRNQVPVTTQRKLRIVVPPLDEQRAIAHVLGTLDDLIELNRETNELLEEMVRALFESWFVDFDPVRAKLEGRPPAGMHAATAALFPDHFQDSELGQIPKGWEVTTLGAVLGTLETGRRPKGGVSGYSSGVPSVGAESINGIGVFDFSKTKFIPNDFYAKTKAGRIDNLDVLLYKDGGKPGEFRPRVGLYGYGFPFDEFCINEHVFRMRADSVGQHFLYFTISDERVLLDFANKGGKAAIPGINQTDVRSTLILLPPKGILAEFDKQAQPICQSIIENFAESRDLATLRDTLLPKLLSGEITL
jgi:type I restriction enzyme S subunit